MRPSKPFICPFNHTSCLLAFGFTSTRRYKIRPLKFPLTKLPLELIQEIASYLPVEDVGSLRLTGKVVERAVFDLFVRRFFKTKQFLMLNKRSRQILDEVSRHPIFSKALEHLILATEREVLYEAEHRCGCYGCGGGPPDDSVGDSNRDSNGASDRVSDGENGVGLDIITDSDGDADGGFQTQRHTKSDAESSAVSAGQIPVMSWSGSWVEQDCPPPEEDFNNDVFWFTLSALARSGVRPRSLEVVHNRRAYCLTDMAFYMPAPGFMAAAIADILTSLAKLELCLYLYSHYEIYPTPNNAPRLQAYLFLATNLTDLRLRWNEYGTVFDAYHSLSWLGRQHGAQLPHSDREMGRMGSARSDNVPDAVHFPRLERLHLDNVMVPPETLVSIVSKFSTTLRVMQFRKVHLIDLSNKVKDRVEIWSPFLKSVANHTDLREWGISYKAGVCYPPEDDDEFEELEFRQVLFEGMEEIAYSGEGGSARLAAAADDVTVVWNGSGFVGEV
ncbi:hypothetical protein GE09DRAFT_1243180 [Coniochaeta sp. 2T2.1]|nr:hypothetical protein GE09DRAFT_1243180 [Coniochaeta sp. 2T2.1]